MYANAQFAVPDAVPSSGNPTDRNQAFDSATSFPTSFGISDVRRLQKRLDALYIDIRVDMHTGHLNDADVLQVLRLMAQYADRLADDIGEEFASLLHPPAA
jgi:hypothetical protein